MLNISLTDNTSLPGDGSLISFASAYLQHDVTHTLWMIVPPTLLALGCYGNVMTIVVMRAMRTSESAGCLSVYFTALAVSDLFLLWTNVLWYWPEMALGIPLFYFHELSCTVPFFVSYVFSMTSAWLLMAMTCQRMMSMVVPHRVEVLCTARKGKIITAVILFTSLVSNLYIFFYFHVEILEEGYPSCVARDRNVSAIFGLLYLCVASVIPFLFLIVSNSVLIWAAVRSVRMSWKMAGHRDTHTSSRVAKVSSMTTTLILTSAAFLLLTLPYCVLIIYFEMIGFYEGAIDDEHLTQQLALADTVCVQLWMTNSSINFYIYVLSGRKFRQEAKRYICPLFKFQQKARHDVKT